jgi:integrase
MALIDICFNLPIKIVKINNIPKIFAGGVPVLPVNLVFKEKYKDGATTSSLETYAYAWKHYIEFCIHRKKSIASISNEEFYIFREALQGSTFFDAEGNAVRLSLLKRRGNRTVDLIITLLYSIAGDIERRYQGTLFSWRLYEQSRLLHGSASILPVAKSSKGATFKRIHRVKYAETPILALPRDQFLLLIDTAYKLWYSLIPDGDAAFSPNPESQRGALFFRNLAILLIMRYGGPRRSEVPPIEFQDVDSVNRLLYLETKGHRADGKRLPVSLFPEIYSLIKYYVTHFRPLNSHGLAEEKQQIIFLSHSTRNYGQPLTDESIRKILERLRSGLAKPWNKKLTPHRLRHSFAEDVQELGGPIALTLAMRHSSIASSKPYLVKDIRKLAAKLSPMNAELAQVLNQVKGLESLIVNPQDLADQNETI